MNEIIEFESKFNNFLFKDSSFVQTHANEDICLSVQDYSSKLQIILKLLSHDSSLSQSSRHFYEKSMEKLLSFAPKLIEFHSHQKSNSENNLSLIILDNYNELIHFIDNYPIITLSSQVMVFMVDLVYALNYWDICFLLVFVPEIVWFLQKIDFQIIHTSRGIVAIPPVDLLSDSLSFGLQNPLFFSFYSCFEPSTF